MKTTGNYVNGQKVSEFNGDIFTYFYKNGKIKATGKLIDGKMEGEWVFNRISGDLWQIGNFNNNQKDGEWIRYNKTGKVEYHAIFKDSKLIEKGK